MKRHSLLFGVMFALTLSSCGGLPSTNSTPSIPKHTVTWKNYDGTILEVDNDVESGSYPEYNGRTPTRPSDEQYGYTFKRWEPELLYVYRDATYTATYNSQLERAKIVFDLDGGTTEHSTVPIYRSTISASDFFFDVKKPSYSFRGWTYKNQVIFDLEKNKKFDPELEETMTFKAFYQQNVYLTVTKNIEDAGTIEGAGLYSYNDTAILEAIPNDGYIFDGWYYNNILISTQTRLSYPLEREDVKLEARFDYRYYKLDATCVHVPLGSVVINNSSQYGFTNTSANVKYRADTIVSARSDTDEYSFSGWYDEEDNLLTRSYVYSFKMPNHDWHLYAKWNSPSYRVIIRKNSERAGTVSGAGYHEYGRDIVLSSTTNDGFTFDGWYVNDVKKSYASTYKFNMPKNDITVEARWNTVTYNITYNLDGGTNSSSNPTTYTADSDYELYAPSKTGYVFEGWTLYGNPIERVGNGMTGDITLRANWSPAQYAINLDPNGGECDQMVLNVSYNSSYTLPTPTRLGYTFNGWYDGSTKVNNTGTWKYTSNKTFTAHWRVITYTIIYQLNGGTNASSNPSSYNVESSTITLANPTKTGYTFTGWTSSGSSVTSIPTGSTGDITLVANWELGNFEVTVVVNNSSLGSVTGSGSYDYGSQVTLTAAPTSDNVFKGWYSDSGFTTLLSTSNSYTFTLDSEGTTIYAKFFTKAEEEEAWNVAHGVTPVYDSSTQTVTYGLYPQTNVNGSALLTALNALTTPKSNGWYLYNDEYYAKLSATPNSSSYVFDNGTTIVSGTTYWFKCEPIVWNVLSNNDGEYYLLSSVLLDTHCYYNSTSYRTIDGQTVCANNYEYSDIRAWLNGDFYNSAFALNNSYIQTTTVDNSASTTNSSYNSYASSNTQDKVFLPSYQDYINSSYGFATSTGSTSTRCCKTTDWARARGACYEKTISSYLYNGLYWTRSPRSSDGAWNVDYDGNLKYSYIVHYANGCVRPSLSLVIA